MKQMIKRCVASLILWVMVATTMLGRMPDTVSAAEKQNNSSSKFLNTITKYLYLDGTNTVTYDFNILTSAMKKGSTYAWYVRQDKGNPASVSIDRKTGIVTANEVGTAYIRCKITLKDKTVIRPEAKVIVRNNITQVEINNLTENMTIAAGREYDFNRSILDTKAGKGEKTKGITRWEVKDDTAGVGSADDKGRVYPVREGEFKIRAISFSDSSDYYLWLGDKSKNKEYITASSQWHRIKVTSSNQTAIATSQEQLNKALAEETLKDITLTTTKAEIFVIGEGNYTDKSLSINAPNADVNNYGIFKEIHIAALKNDTWIEYADGNIIHLTDAKLRFVIAEDAKVKRIVVDQPNAAINLEINGTVEEIVVLQPADLVLTGSSKDVLLRIDEQAGSSKVTTSVPLKLKTKANTTLVLNQGSEGTGIDKNASSIEVTIDNRSTTVVAVTTNEASPEYFEAGKSGVSNAATAPAPVPASSGNSETSPSTPVITPELSELSIAPSHMVMSVTGSAISVLTAVMTPEDVTDISVSWQSMDEEVVKVDQDGVLTPVGLGWTTVIASTGDKFASAKVTVVSGSAISIIDEAMNEGNLQSAAAGIALEVGKGAAGWALAESGIYKDPTQQQLEKMQETLNEMSVKLDQLDKKLSSIYKGLQSRMTLSEYNTRVSTMQVLVSDIISIKKDLTYFVKSPPKDPTDMAKMRNEIKESIKNKLLNKEYYIHNILIGEGLAEPLLKTWSKVVEGNRRFLSSEDFQDVVAMFEYYEMLQTWLFELQVEYYRTEYKDSETKVDDLYARYLENINKQKEIVYEKRPIPKDIIIDREQNIMIYKGYMTNFLFNKIQAPLYARLVSYDFYSMCNWRIYNNWRLLTNTEFQSWIKAWEDSGKRAFYSNYLLESGWNINLDTSRKICIKDTTLGKPSYIGYNITTGAVENYIINIPFTDNYIDMVNSSADPMNDYSFYFIFVRTYLDHELDSYFY